MPRRIRARHFYLGDTQQQQEPTIQIFAYHSTQLLVSQLSSEISPKLDLSIEGMRSQQFSEGVFAFLLLGIVVFSGIVIALIFSKNRPEEVRFGERMMFAAIISGVVVAVI
ncbi:MAG: hypothetical protein WCF09_03670, partial [Gallionella sp.]